MTDSLLSKKAAGLFSHLRAEKLLVETIAPEGVASDMYEAGEFV